MEQKIRKLKKKEKKNKSKKKYYDPDAALNLFLKKSPELKMR
jgi:hypothetical protein